VQKKPLFSRGSVIFFGRGRTPDGEPEVWGGKSNEKTKQRNRRRERKIGGEGKVYSRESSLLRKIAASETSGGNFQRVGSARGEGSASIRLRLWDPFLNIGRGEGGGGYDSPRKGKKPSRRKGILFFKLNVV